MLSPCALSDKPIKTVRGQNALKPVVMQCNVVLRHINAMMFQGTSLVVYPWLL